jgi:putative ABC transport system substrate-binding protein
MKRRAFIVAGAGFALPVASIAQRSGIPRVGFLISETLSGQASRINAVRAGLRELGYTEGKDIVIESRTADGHYDRLPGLAAELVRLKVDVLVAFGAKAVVAARNTTSTVPIVVPATGDPIALGVVGDLAKPGGNVTGLAIFGPEISAKWLEFLKEAVPGVGRVAVLRNAANPSGRSTTGAMQAAAKSLQLELQSFEIRSRADFTGAFAAMANSRVDGVCVSGDTLFQAHWKEIAALAEKHRLPAVGRREFVEAGGLIGYGADDAQLFRRAAYFVDRILKGAKPADLPVERPTRFELLVNAKTARALGVKVPQSLLQRADRVIE